VDLLLKDPEEAGFADLLGRLGSFEDRSGGVAELAFGGGHWRADESGGERKGKEEGVGCEEGTGGRWRVEGRRGRR